VALPLGAARVLLATAIVLWSLLSSGLFVEFWRIGAGAGARALRAAAARVLLAAVGTLGARGRLLSAVPDRLNSAARLHREARSRGMRTMSLSSISTCGCASDACLPPQA